MDQVAAGHLNAEHLGRPVRVAMFSDESPDEEPVQLVGGRLTGLEHRCESHADGPAGSTTTTLTIDTIGQAVTLVLAPGHPVAVGALRP